MAVDTAAAAADGAAGSGRQEGGAPPASKAPAAEGAAGSTAGSRPAAGRRAGRRGGRMRKRRMRGRVSERSVQSGGMTARALMAYGPVRRAHDWFAMKYAKDVPASGVAVSPRVKAAETITYAAYAAPAGAAVAFLLFLMLGTPLALAALCLPVIVYFARLYGLRDAIRKRASAVESELFFFVIFCDIMEKTGRGLYGAFEAVQEAGSAAATAAAAAAAEAEAKNRKKGKKNKKKAGGGGGDKDGGRSRGNLFPALYAEAMIIQREMRVFTRSFADMLHELGFSHPSTAFRDFLRGYAVSQSTGGVGTSAYLAEKLREYHVAAKQRMESYVSTAEMLATVGSFGLVMFPMFVVVGGIMIDGSTLLFMCAFGILFIPVIIIMLIKKAASASPVPAPSVKVDRRPLAAAGIAGVVCAILQLEWWECAAVPLIVWSISNYVASRKLISGAAGLEKSIPTWIRDIGQKTRSNPSFFAAFSQTEKSAAYTRQFNAVLRAVRSRVSLGVTMSQAMRDARTDSWLADCVLRLMAHAARSGSVTPAVLERLALFASQYLETKQEMASKTVNSLMTGYMGSIIVVMMLLMIPSMSFDQFGAYEELLDVGTSGVSLSDSSYDPGALVADLNLVLVVVGAFCSMMLVTQIRYSTVLYSLHTGVLLLVIAILLYYDRYVGVSLG